MKTVMHSLIACTLSLYALGVAAAGDPAIGKEKAQACQACHGADGNSPDPQFPRLAGQHSDYLVKALQDYKSGERKNAIMLGLASALSDEDVEHLAAFFASQKGDLKAIDFKK